MKRSKCSLSHYKLLTGDMGELLPISCFEVLPGDTIQQATSCLIRTMPMLAPVMHPVKVRIHHWFVPNRLIWSEWEKFITGADTPTHPTITLATNLEGSLADYLGIPPSQSAQVVNALPFRAYAKIWNEYYRDQNLNSALTEVDTSGNDTFTNQTLKKVCWEKDYFTSARLTPQQGDAVSIPMTGEITTGSGPGPTLSSPQYPGDGAHGIYAEQATQGDMYWGQTPTGNTRLKFADPDLAFSSPGITIDDLRTSFAMQRYAEARARYGSRYTEYLRYLGINPQDARLDRPEYLGGGKQTIQISEVLQTGVTTSGTESGVGNLYGHGIGALRSNRYRKFFQEHGIVMSLLSVVPRTMYCQGREKMWSRTSKFDYHQREFEQVGQAEVLNKEIYADAAAPDSVFGYQDRYDEYRRKTSSIAAEFRSTMDHWHLARIFASEPALNSALVECSPSERIFPVLTSDVLWIMANHSIQARRPIGRVK